MNQGRPKFFDVDKYLDAVEMTINADDVEFAFTMLEQITSYYRDNPTERQKEIKKSLHRQLFTPVQYKGIYNGAQDINVSQMERWWPLRARVLEDEIKKLNKIGIMPNVMELAPGQFWLPQGLKHKGCDFTYEHKSIDETDMNFESPVREPEAHIFCAFELIEHLHHEEEIYENYLKFNREADVIMISTPLYTTNGGEDNWRVRPLGHLRTYTPFELFNKVNKMFDGYEWQSYADSTIVMIGRKKC